MSLWRSLATCISSWSTRWARSLYRRCGERSSNIVSLGIRSSQIDIIMASGLRWIEWGWTREITPGTKAPVFGGVKHEVVVFHPDWLEALRRGAVWPIVSLGTRTTSSRQFAFPAIFVYYSTSCARTVCVICLVHCVHHVFKKWGTKPQ